MSRQWNLLLGAALDAAERGWHVFPLVPAGKTPAVRDWEQRATTDKRQIYRWWTNDSSRNVGIAAGKSGLVVIDLDDGRGISPPERFAGARNGRDVLAMLATEVGTPISTDTYEVATPGGSHLYFRSPPGLELGNTVGSLGWKIDSRSVGGYIVAAGSRRAEGDYRVVDPGPARPLPPWLLAALTRPPLPPRQLVRLRPGSPRLAAYVQAALDGETLAVENAGYGTRADAVFKAAAALGELVGAGALPRDVAEDALRDAADRHNGIQDWTPAEAERHIRNGLERGIANPRRIQ